MAFSEKSSAKWEDILKNIQHQERCSSPKVSVIVPVYNRENYIGKCLLSLTNQTEKEIEIIIVNDGSKDNTLKTANDFAKRDFRIKIISQEHQLQGAARNNGIKNAAGEYIGFVDSDDWVDADYFEKLYKAAKKYNSDLALATNIRIGNGRTKKRLNIKEEKHVNALQEKFDICHLKKDGCPTNKIYKREFLEKHNIMFPEGVYCEDKLFTTKAVYYANGIVTAPDTYYYYFRNPNSTVKNNKMKNHKNNARLEVLKFLRENNASVRDGDFWAVTKEIRFFGIPLYMKKESLKSEKHYILSFIKIKENKL